MKYNHRNRISLSCYEYAFQTWPSKYPESPIPLPLTHIHRDNTDLLSFRTLKHSEFLIKMSTLC